MRSHKGNRFNADSPIPGVGAVIIIDIKRDHGLFYRIRVEARRSGRAARRFRTYRKNIGPEKDN